MEIKKMKMATLILTALVTTTLLVPLVKAQISISPAKSIDITNKGDTFIERMDGSLTINSKDGFTEFDISSNTKIEYVGDIKQTNEWEYLGKGTLTETTVSNKELEISGNYVCTKKPTKTTGGTNCNDGTCMTTPKFNEFECIYYPPQLRNVTIERYVEPLGRHINDTMIVDDRTLVLTDKKTLVLTAKLPYDPTKTVRVSGDGCKDYTCNNVINVNSTLYIRDFDIPFKENLTSRHNLDDASQTGLDIQSGFNASLQSGGSPLYNPTGSGFDGSSYYNFDGTATFDIPWDEAYNRSQDGDGQSVCIYARWDNDNWKSVFATTIAGNIKGELNAFQHDTAKTQYGELRTDAGAGENAVGTVVHDSGGTTWYQTCLTMGVDGHQLYNNGVTDGSINANTDHGSGVGQVFKVGNADIQWDELRIWNVTLPAASVLYMYNQNRVNLTNVTDINFSDLATHNRANISFDAQGNTNDICAVITGNESCHLNATNNIVLDEGSARNLTIIMNGSGIWQGNITLVTWQFEDAPPVVDPCVPVNGTSWNISIGCNLTGHYVVNFINASCTTWINLSSTAVINITGLNGMYRETNPSCSWERHVDSRIWRNTT